MGKGLSTVTEGEVKEVASLYAYQSRAFFSFQTLATLYISHAVTRIRPIFCHIGLPSILANVDE